MVEFLSAIKHAAAVGVLSCLVSESEIMASVRALTDYLPECWLTDKLKELLICPICLAFWFGTPALLIGFDYYFLVVAISNAWMLIILKVYESLESTGI